MKNFRLTLTTTSIIEQSFENETEAKEWQLKNQFPDTEGVFECIELKNTLKIVHDNDFQCDWEFLPTMVQYSGYKLHQPKEDSVSCWDNLCERIADVLNIELPENFDYEDESIEEILEKHTVWQELRMYKHSGITIRPSHGGAHIGYVFIPKSKIKEEFSCKRIGKSVAKKAMNLIDGMIDTIDEIIRGNVYGFQVIDQDGEIGHSCYGFVGEDFEGIAAHCGFSTEEVKEAFQNIEY